MIARLFIPGRARTKGHIENFVTGRGSGKITVRNADREVLKRWMAVMISEMRKQLGIIVQKQREVGSNGKARLVIKRVDGIEPYAGPVEVCTFFRFHRELNSVADVWPSHDTLWPTALDIGDEDTLRRAVLDALTQAGVLDDDRWVVGGTNYKRWCEPGEEAGVLIVVREADRDVMLTAEADAEVLR